VCKRLCHLLKKDWIKIEIHGLQWKSPILSLEDLASCMSTGATCQTHSFPINHFLVVMQHLQLETIAKKRASLGNALSFSLKSI
jgi:cysteine sulfinate desulfinase/cysteine desulfurase-like protein